jgi:integrase/recombinase XerD
MLAPFNLVRYLTTFMEVTMPEFGRSPPDYLDVKVRSGNISLPDADLLLRFVTETANQIGHNQHTQLSNTRYLSVTIENIPNIQDWTNAIINEYVSKVRATGKANTQRKRILLLKSFCEWLVENKLNTSLVIESIRKIKAPASDKLTKTSAMMLSVEQIDRIISGGRNTRDRCLLSVLSESGMRPFEALRLTWGELKIDDNGVIINTSGKTGVPRFIRLVHSAPYVANWRNDTPFKDDDAFVFTSLKSPAPDVRITHSALKKIVRLAAKKAGVKNVFPYLFRHSNVTRMLSEGYSDSTIRMVHWGSQKTGMLATYGHVSAPAIDAEILGKSGIKSLEEKKKRVPHQCSKCHMITKPTDEFCPRCGTGISDEAKAQIVREHDQLTKHIMELVSERFLQK